jgi:hypothetical protein
VPTLGSDVDIEMNLLMGRDPMAEDPYLGLEGTPEQFPTVEGYFETDMAGHVMPETSSEEDQTPHSPAGGEDNVVVVEEEPATQEDDEEVMADDEVMADEEIVPVAAVFVTPAEGEPMPEEARSEEAGSEEAVAVTVAVEEAEQIEPVEALGKDDISEAAMASAVSEDADDAVAASAGSGTEVASLQRAASAVVIEESLPTVADAIASAQDRLERQDTASRHEHGEGSHVEEVEEVSPPPPEDDGQEVLADDNVHEDDDTQEVQVRGPHAGPRSVHLRCALGESI